MKKDLVVLSGANLFAGGTLKIYRKILFEINKMGYDQKYQIVCFINDKKLFDGIAGDFEFIELPDARNSIKRRLFYEYVYYRKWSRDRDVYIWIAMHDLSPNVVAKKRYTYFQSAQLFYKMPRNLIRLDRHEYLRSITYKYLVGRNIKTLDGVIVQAPWIAKKFEEMYGLKRAIVTRAVDRVEDRSGISTNNDVFTFSYPSLPRVFKNFETVCKACRKLEKEGLNFRMILTINGSENRYTSFIRREYSDCNSIEWVGEIPYEHMCDLYEKTNVMVFASSLETWGLPITEFSAYGRPIIVVDKEYAHFTTAGIKKVLFFDEYNYSKLAELMRNFICNSPVEYDQTDKVSNNDFGWEHLLREVFSNGEKEE